MGDSDGEPDAADVPAPSDERRGTTRVNFDFTIDEPIANISYGNGTYIIPRDALVDIAPTIVGGAVASFAINSTSFRSG